MLPGSSRSGKSSLTMGLLLQGCGYLSDELTAMATTSLELVAFPKPLSCRDVSIFPELANRQDVWFGPVIRDPQANAREPKASSPIWFAHPDDVRPGSVSEPVRVSHLVFPQHTPGAKPRLRRMSKGDAMRNLLRQTVNFTLLEGQGLHLLARIVEQSECYSLCSNGFPDTSQLILDLAGVPEGRG